MNLIITGKPRAGKTTLVKEIISVLSGQRQIFGFYTEQVIEGGRRVGFLLKTIDGKTKILAHINFHGAYRVGKYGVDLETMWLGIKSIEQGLKKGSLIVIDEIGKMELLLPDFRRITWKALDSSCDVLATMGIIEDDFIFQIKERPDVNIYTLIAKDNYPTLRDLILERFGIYKCP